MTFKIYTLGCKVNFYDSNSLKAELISAGLSPIENNADFAVVNTCAVTKAALKKDRQVFQKAKRENPRAKIFLAGCMTETYKEDAKRLGADFIFGTNKTDEMLTQINKLRKHSIIPSCAENLVVSSGDRSRYFIKIQDGCEQYCSYCIIPYARGGLKSRGEGEILDEIKQAAANGYREIVLSGIHLGLWGKDLKKKSLKINLAGLLKKIIKIKNLGRIRLSSIEATEVTDELISLMKNSDKKICKHLHIPLQAGCDKILRRMNRPYDTEFFESVVAKARRVMPDMAITTDVIVGFPGETEKDFHETVNFIKKINFSKLHVFPFSAHERTAAAKMDGKVGDGELRKRSEILRKLSERLEKSYNKKFKGKELDIAVVKIDKNGLIKGKSEFYFDAVFKPRKKISAEVGDIVRAKNWV